MPRSDHLSDFELYVMLAVAALDGGAYGVSIATRINDRTGRDVSIGAVYATLGRLADKRYVSFSVSDPEPVRGGRTREIGTRIALGATRQDILWLVMREGALIAAGGTIAGLLISLAATRSLASILYGVSASDPATLSVAAGVLIATIMAACYLPARRAASVDPARTLAEL